MPKQLLDGSDVGATLQEVGGEAMSKSVTTRCLGNTGGADGELDRVLEIFLGNMVAAEGVATGIDR